MKLHPCHDPEWRAAQRANGMAHRAPDFSPRMLRLFLHARAVARDGFERRPMLARRDLVGELIETSGLPESALKDAFAGRLNDAGQRAALWAALGQFPVDDGVRFNGRGGQHA